MKRKMIGTLVCMLLIVTAVLPVAGYMGDRLNQKRNDTALGPDLVYSPTSHDFGNVAQGQTYQTTFQIWNGGSGTMTFNLGIVHTWISPNPTSGKSDGSWDKVTITVTIDTTGLSIGSHSGFVSITANDGGGVRYFNIDCNVVTNNPPNTPSKPNGPTSVVEGVQYAYTTSTTDPDDDNVKYGFDFDNDDFIEPEHWTSFLPSGATCTVTIIFYGVGTRYLRAKAEDVHVAQSGFSSALVIEVSGSNNPPNTPSTPSGPMSGSVGTSYSYSISTTDDDGDQIKYGFDWDGNGIVDDWSSLLDSGDPCSMSHSWSSAGTYQVKVKARDEHGAESGWSSTLTVIISAGNNAPNKPDTPSGQTNGKAGISYAYSTSTEDLDGDQVWYKWDWGDEVSNWDGPYTSGDPVTTSHIWSNQGTYAVKVKAKDTSDAESVWSDPLSVSMPKNKRYVPSGIILAFGFDVDVKIVQLEPGEDYVDLEVLNKPFYIWENEIETTNSGAFIRLYSAKGLFLPSLPFCFGTCQDWGIIG
jgi:hypothetical protein